MVVYFIGTVHFGKCPNELVVALNEYINVEAIQNHVPLLKLPLVLGQV